MFYKKITADTDDALNGLKRIRGVRLVAAAADASAILYDDAAVSGASHDFCKLALDIDVEGLSDRQMFGRDPLILERGLSVDMTGAGAILYVYYE